MRAEKKYLNYFLLLLFCALSFFSFSQQPIKIACIGNSVTYGYTHKNPQLTSYPSQQKNVVPYGPMITKAVKQNNQIILCFQYADGLKTNDGKTLRGFKIVNEKGVQTKAKAFIQNHKIIIPVNENENAVKVLYGWEPYTDANLINGENLPASTFKTTIQ